MFWTDKTKWRWPMAEGNLFLDKLSGQRVLDIWYVRRYCPNKRKHWLKESTQQVHQILIPTCAFVQHCHHSIIVTPTAHRLPFPCLSPHGCCHHDRDQLLRCYICMLTSPVHAVSLQASWNHHEFQKAPQPHFPDASDIKVTVGSCPPVAARRETPSQSLRNL